jgi:tetratricopeptide (TPR) repeat protein
VYNGALVAVMSDHGESLGDHGETTHGVFLYDATLRVPLLIKFPNNRFAGQRASARASLVDVAPTLLDATHTPLSTSMQGHSLVPLIGLKSSEDRPSFAENEYPRRGFGWSALESLRTGTFLFVKAPVPELYDQDADSGNERNLYEVNKLAAARIGAQLNGFQKRAGANAPDAARASLGPESAEKLRALGYMPSIGAEGPRDAVDPKAHIQVSNDLHEANLKIEEGRETAAIPLLERVVASDPQIPHAQYFLGVAYKALKQYDKAIPHLSKAIALVPDSMMAQYEIALALYATGALDTAATHLEIVVAQSPDWADARFSLASIYARTERVPEAMAHLEITLQIDPDHYRAHLLRGRILSLQGNAGAALPDLERAARLEPKSSEAHQFLAEAYSQLGQSENAAREHATAEQLKAPNPK